VNGPNADEVYKFLRYSSELFLPEEGILGHIHWNFGKFLVDAATGKEV
jgi:glutathione peroxidase-family protein